MEIRGRAARDAGTCSECREGIGPAGRIDPMANVYEIELGDGTSFRLCLDCLEVVVTLFTAEAIGSATEGSRETREGAGSDA